MKNFCCTFCKLTRDKRIIFAARLYSIYHFVSYTNIHCQKIFDELDYHIIKNCIDAQYTLDHGNNRRKIKC